MKSISPSTWNTLGLSVAATFAILGTYAVLDPKRTNAIFNSQPPSNNNNEPSQTNFRGVAALVASRDMTLAAALFALYRAGQTDAMGTVLLSSMIICGADIYLVWASKRYSEVVSFTIGTAVWAVIGLGLKGYFN